MVTKFDEETIADMGEIVEYEKEDIYISPDGGDIELSVMIDGKNIVEDMRISVIDLKTILMAIGYGQIGIEKYKVNFVDMVM